jgi:hypothetical protein
MRMRHLVVVPALFVLIASALPGRAAGTAGARGSTYIVLYHHAATPEAARAGRSGGDSSRPPTSTRARARGFSTIKGSVRSSMPSVPGRRPSTASLAMAS